MNCRVRGSFITILLSVLLGGLAGGLTALVVQSRGNPDTGIMIRSRLNNPSSSANKTASDALTNEEDITTDVVKKVSPSVVSIIITKELSQSPASSRFSPFEQFFGPEFFPNLQPPQSETPSAPKQKQDVGGGTGFFISTDGLILTNKHVVSDTEAEYSVITNDGKRYDNARVLARDPFVDVALIKIDVKNTPVVKLGSSKGIKIGQTVIAIGNSLSEFPNTVTKGVVSGINRRVVAGGASFGSEVIEEAIQTDAAINPGNSGGPLVNLAGEVIAVNTAVSREGQLIGFAIPIDSIKPAIDSVKQFGRIVRPWLGVRYIIINKSLAAAQRLPVDYGALIIRGDARTDLAVIPGSPADKAGLRENDIILELDGNNISSDQPLASQIQKHKPGDKVKLKVLSQGKEKMVEVTLVELK